MTSEQHKTGDEDKFQEKLIKIAAVMGMGEGEFAVWIGYTVSHISKVKNGRLPVDRTLELLLDTLLENHRMKQELARVRGAAAELFGAISPPTRSAEAPVSPIKTASSPAAAPPPQTAAEALALAENRERGLKRSTGVPIVTTSKPSRGTQRPAAAAPKAKAPRP